MTKSKTSRFDVRGSRNESAGHSAPNGERRTSNGASLIFPTRWGWLGLAASRKGLRAIVLPKPSRQAVERALAERLSSKFEVRCSWNGGGTGGRGQNNPQPGTSDLAPLLRKAQRQLRAYLTGKRRSLDLPIDLAGGTPFQRRVWRAARRIPYGRARSYGWIAAKVGGKRYARAVGAALRANPLPLIVPCHRVVAPDGSLGGFSGGLAIKRKLLVLEGTWSQLRRKV